ncbi:DMT family transporter [bacterium]|nr:MAG: DMT family transporter [bacterium]
MPRLKTRTFAYSILLLNTALWGFSAPIIKYSFQFISPSLFLFYRYIFATSLFLPIFLLYRSRTKHHIDHTKTLILALLGTPLVLLPLFYGLNQTTAIEASIIESSSPIFTVLLCLLFLKETIKPKEWKGLALAIIGTFMITLEPLITGHNHIRLSVQGNLLIIFSNIIWTAFILLSKKFKTNPVYLSFYSFIISIPFFYFISTSGNLSFSLNPQALPGILYMAIGGSIIAFWAYQEGQRRIEASEAAVFTYLKPAFAIPLSIIWLKEAFSPVAIIATIFIVIGVFVSENR